MHIQVYDSHVSIRRLSIYVKDFQWKSSSYLHTFQISFMNCYGAKVSGRRIQNGIGNVLIPICLMTKQEAFSPTETWNQTSLAAKDSFILCLHNRSKSWVDINIFFDFTRRKLRSSGLICKGTKCLVEIWMRNRYDWRQYWLKELFYVICVGLLTERCKQYFSFWEPGNWENFLWSHDILCKISLLPMICWKKV